MWLFVVVTVVLGYLLGNLNGAVLVSRSLHDDVREHGSGNAGLTNFIRNYGTGRAISVIAIDGIKTVAACLLGGLLLSRFHMFSEGLAIGGTAVMLGHAYPVVLGFRGGKSILSGLFVAIVIDWRIALLILAVFAIVYGLTRYVSLGSVLAAVTFSIGFAVFHHDRLVVMLCGIFMGLFAVFTHRENIVRLIRKQERKTDLFSKK